MLDVREVESISTPIALTVSLTSINKDVVGTIFDFRFDDPVERILVA